MERLAGGPQCSAMGSLGAEYRGGGVWFPLPKSCLPSRPFPADSRTALQLTFNYFSSSLKTEICAIMSESPDTNVSSYRNSSSYYIQ